MNKTIIINQLSIISTIFTIIFLFQIFINGLNEKIFSLDIEKQNLSLKIDSYYIPQQIEFENTFKNITKYITKTDSFMGIGGTYGETPVYFDSLLFNDILNTDNTNNFVLFVNNTEKFFDSRSKYFNDLPSIWPVEYSPRLQITSMFEERFDPFTAKIQKHDGIDMVSTIKAKVIATAPGKVISVWSPKKGHPVYGGCIIIEHKNGYRTTYAHLSEIYVKKNSIIIRGMTIGRIGNTGLSKGAHLHYQIEKYEENIKSWILLNPINFLRSVE